MPPKETRYYDLLEVSPDASAEDMKKSYRNLARKYHPDRNPEGAQIFQEISHAYDVLSNPEKRRVYDRLGEKGINEGAANGGGGGMDIFDLFSGGLFGGGGGGGPRRPEKAKEIQETLQVTLEELYNGSKRQVKYVRRVTCTECRGSGGKGGKHVVRSCNSCQGHGVKVTLRQISPGMVQQLQTRCPDCNGTGEFLPEKDRCTKCRGEKVVRDERTQQVDVERGMEDGQNMRFHEEGHVLPNLMAGDLYVVIQQQDHPVFARSGADLIVVHSITLCEALCGFSFTLKHLDNEARYLRISSAPGEVIQPGAIKVIPEQGMPIHGRPFDKGRLIIKFQVEFPASISEADAALIKKVLPQGAPDLEPESNAHIVPVVASEDYKPEKNQGRRGRAGPSSHDEEEQDDDQPRSEGISCAQQ